MEENVNTTIIKLKNINKIEEKINKGKYFSIKKRNKQNEKNRFWSLGEKGMIFEPFQARMYTHGDLFSHVIGQVDYDNYGISGIEKYFDRELKNKRLKDTPFELTIDSNIQYLSLIHI